MGFLLLLHFEDELDIHAEADADPEAIEIQTPDGAIESDVPSSFRQILLLLSISFWFTPTLLIVFFFSFYHLFLIIPPPKSIWLNNIHTIF